MNEFKEDDHKRDKDGKFAKTGGGSSDSDTGKQSGGKKKSSQPTYEEIPAQPSKPIAEYIKDAGGDYVSGARDFYKAEFQGKIVKTSLGEHGVKDVLFLSSGIDELRRDMKNNPLKVEIIPQLPEILRTGTYQATEDNSKNPNSLYKAFHYVRKDGVPTSRGPKDVIVDIRQRKDGHFEYSLYSVNYPGLKTWAKKLAEVETLKKKRAGNDGQHNNGSEACPSTNRSLFVDETVAATEPKVNICIIGEEDMQTRNHNSKSIKFANWRIDDDGILRCTARVLAEGVFPYLPDESPEGAQETEPGIVGQYIPASEFTAEALASLEGKPVIIDDHVWRDAENTMHDGLTVGAVAGKPHVEDGFIVCDFIISDAKAIEEIKAGTLVEVSSAYTGDGIAENGNFEGSPYGSIQTNLRFNHVLLLPEGSGRCGHEVRIVNQKKAKEKETMPKIIQRQFGNRRVDFKFQNEDDACTANEMAEEERKFNAEQLNEAIETASQLKAEIEEKQKALDEALAVVKEQKEEIDRLMSAETQEEMAAEAAAQQEAEEAILDDAIENEVIEEEEKEEIKNSFKNCKTFADRRRVVVQNAMGVSASDIKGWSQDAIDGAFESLNHRAALRVKNSKGKTVMGGAKGKTQNSQPDALQRILRPLKLKNGKTAE